MSALPLVKVFGCFIDVSDSGVTTASATLAMQGGGGGGGAAP